MKFTVVWTPAAERDLAAIWIHSGDRNMVSSAANRIDRALRDNANRIGEIIFDSVRTMFVDPLGVDFDVSELDRLVYVLSVWKAG
ncbi:MAG TPA: type II toxin-antitoxin system RelE/ParE family toxin [Pirellulales bacterium]